VPSDVTRDPSIERTPFAVVEQAGETQVYAFHHAAQGHDQERHFCSRCGTTLFGFLSTASREHRYRRWLLPDDGLQEPAYSVTDRKREAWVSLPSHWQVDPQ
jgi:hypothetical protein